MLDKAATRYGLASRERKWELYRRAFPPSEGERVLDVGVSRFDDLPGANYFLRRYPFPSQLTAVGISDLSCLRSRYPEVELIEADGRDLPFADRSFDVVHSNAVVEHVGSREEQRRFVSELVRVANAGFITTPNRWFPIESHVRLPLLHWLPRPLAVVALSRLGHDAADLASLEARVPRAVSPDVSVTLVTERMAACPAALIALFRRH